MKVDYSITNLLYYVVSFDWRVEQRHQVSNENGRGKAVDIRFHDFVYYIIALLFGQSRKSEFLQAKKASTLTTKGDVAK